MNEVQNDPESANPNPGQDAGHGLPPGVQSVLQDVPPGAGPAGGVGQTVADPSVASPGFTVGREAAAGIARRFWASVGKQEQRRIYAAGVRHTGDRDFAASVAAEFALSEPELDNWAGLSAEALEYLKLSQFANPVLALAALFVTRQVFIGMAVSSFKSKGRESGELEAEGRKRES